MTMLRQLLHRDQQGTSSVEFAMVAVVLFIIMFGTIGAHCLPPLCHASPVQRVVRLQFFVDIGWP